MRRFVLGWRKLGHEKPWKAYIVNCADDLVICCRVGAEQALTEMRAMMSKLKLTVNENRRGSVICRKRSWRLIVNYAELASHLGLSATSVYTP